MTTSITTRAGKGSPLTHDEVDANFTNLQTTADAALPLAGGTLTGPVTMTGGTVTTSTPLVDATQTWNAAGVTFTGLKLNITNTASASGSKFAEFQISGTPIVWMEKSGAVVVTSPSDTNKAFRLDSAPGGGLRLEYAGNLEARMSSSGVDLRSNGLVSWSSSAGQADSPGFTCIGRNADGVLEINNQTAGTYRDLMLRNLLAVGGTVTTSTPLIDATQTWNAGGVTFTGWKLNVTDTASASGSKLVDWQVGGSSVQYIDKNGATFFLGGSVSAPSVNISGGGITSGFWNRGAYDIGVSHNGKLTHRFANTAIRCYDSNENQQLLIDGQQTLIKFGPSEDAGVARNAAGVVEVNSGSVGTFRDLKVRNLLAGGGNGSYIQTPSMKVANLASAATAGAGARAFVTDATATTFLSTVAGGGSNKVPVVSDGTNWLIG